MQETYRSKIDRFKQETTALPKVIVVCGPTACGKTALSLEIAEYIQTEIISTDSRQIYRYMDIGTGKIGIQEMRGIQHHMIDLITPIEIFSVVDFVHMALPIIERIQSEGKVPILCGGTGLYIDGLLYAMAYPDTPPDWEYRAELEKIRLSKGNQKLWGMLEKVDPEYAQMLDPDNYRYIMRGLEVIEQTGESKLLSKGKKTLRFSPLFLTPYDDMYRSTLYSNIDKRVKEMFENGLIQEVEYNMNRFGPHCPGLNTIGYREIVEALEGKMSLENAKLLIQQRSRNYAKRQITWNKRYE